MASASLVKQSSMSSCLQLVSQQAGQARFEVIKHGIEFNARFHRNLRFNLVSAKSSPIRW